MTPNKDFPDKTLHFQILFTQIIHKRHRIEHFKVESSRMYAAKYKKCK